MSTFFAKLISKVRFSRMNPILEHRRSSHEPPISQNFAVIVNLKSAVQYVPFLPRPLYGRLVYISSNDHHLCGNVS